MDMALLTVSESVELTDIEASAPIAQAPPARGRTNRWARGPGVDGSLESRGGTTPSRRTRRTQGDEELEIDEAAE